MADIFLQEDANRLLDNRFIVIIGDSIQRGVYKDLVLLLQKNRYLTESNLRQKGEFTFCGDKLIEGGQMGEMTNGVKYREVRQYQTDYHLIRFYFVTRCYNAYMESILADISKDPIPDVILMNSCLWDISRYGPNGVEEYKKNLSTLFQRFNDVLPKTCLVMWNCTLPISKKARGGFLIPAIEFMNNTLRLDILEANFYTHKIACVSGINVLDLHYFLRHQLQRRAGDGVHWDMTAHRRMTNLILTHVAQSWNVTLPVNAKKILLREQMEREKFNQQGTNKMDENSNHMNMMNANSKRGLVSNPNYFKHVVNKISTNFANNLSNAYHSNNNFRTATRNMNNLNDACHNEQMFQHSSPNMNPNQQQLMSRQNKTLLRDRYNQDWVTDSQQEMYIERYGGPIRPPDYMEPAVDQMMNMGNQQCVSQLNWEPYRNDQLGWEPHRSDQQNWNARQGTGNSNQASSNQGNSNQGNSNKQREVFYKQKTKSRRHHQKIW